MGEIDIPCPLREGLHIWLWPGGHNEGWRTAKEQAERALSLGAVGVIPQASLIAPAWLAGKDQGESKARFEIFQDAGLQVTAGLGMDGKNATRETIVKAVLDSLALPNVCVMGDEESEVKWENAAGRSLAATICDDVISARPDAPARCVFCPWWKPSVHSGAPDHEFWKLFRHLFCQDYGAHGPTKGDDTLWMMNVSRKEYAARGIPPEYVHLAAQMYQHSLDAAIRILFSGERVMCLWDVEEMDTTFATVLHAYRAIQHLGFATTIDGIAAFQAAHSLSVTRTLDDATLKALAVL